MEGQIGNRDVATAASMKRLLPHEHKPLGQNESGASDPAVDLEASELTRVGEESVRDVILPRGAMPDEKRGVRRIIVFSGERYDSCYNKYKNLARFNLLICSGTLVNI